MQSLNQSINSSTNQTFNPSLESLLKSTQNTKVGESSGQNLLTSHAINQISNPDARSQSAHLEADRIPKQEIQLESTSTESGQKAILEASNGQSNRLSNHSTLASQPAGSSNLDSSLIQKQLLQHIEEVKHQRELLDQDRKKWENISFLQSLPSSSFHDSTLDMELNSVLFLNICHSS